MAAISKAWVTIADSAVDPDSPGDSTLMTGLRDNEIHLREWLGADFTAGAVKNHNHDGVNSALVPIGANLIRNGSFEENGTGWTITDYSGGSHAFSTSTRHHGEKSLSFTSTSTANGGGDALSNEFIPVTEGRTYRVDYMLSASGANVSSRAQVVWYDAAKSQISAANIYDLTNTPTARTHYSSPMVAPTNARFARVKVIGGVPGAGASTGTIFFDGVFFSDPPSGLVKLASGTLSAVASLDLILTQYAGYKNKMVRLNSIAPASDAVDLRMRVSKDAGATYDTGSAQYYQHTINGSQSTSVGHTAGTDTDIKLAISVGNAGNENATVEVELTDMSNAARFPSFWARANQVQSDASATSRVVSGQRLAAQLTDAVRFLFSAGNIASGSWELYGHL